MELHGRFAAYRSGHALNISLLRALLADTTALRMVASEPLIAAA